MNLNVFSLDTINVRLNLYIIFNWTLSIYININGFLDQELIIFG